MKVKVKKCSNPTWWYAGMIGQEFDVVDEREYYYEVNYGENDVKYTISKEDCEAIPDVVLSGTIGMEKKPESPLRVKIVRSRDSNVWYHHRVGQTFDVEPTIDGSRYIVTNPGKDYLSHILPADCEVISVEITTHDTEPELTVPNVKTIKMSLDTAREWYKLAKQNESNNTQPAISWILENFTKEELEPKKGFTWDDSFDGEGFCIETQHHALILRARNKPIDFTSKRLFKTKEQAESALAFAQLTHIVAKYNEGKSCVNGYYYSIFHFDDYNDLVINYGRSNYLGISFVNEEDARLSMEVNKDLWKQYWMIK